ncbi:MAG: ABC transporter ATP-binding protein [Candidatus Bipolaricaulota bacterium]|nr:ABC transporter ATP-binding protein [Candidatus Bipolaricaulota bacterium]
MRLRAQDLVYAYVPGRPVLQGITLELRSGETTFLLGPNGSGKTTFLDLIGGLRAPLDGKVLLDERPLASFSPRERAQLVGYVPQFHEPPFNFTAWEVVLMGRAPYVRWLSQPKERDRRAADAALTVLALAPFRDRPYYTLSGGERRLVLVARGLAQGAAFLLLDEPDAHLDPANQHRVLLAVQEVVGEGLGAGITSHSPNNALLYADRVALFSAGEVLAQGVPAAVVAPPLLERAYGIPFVSVGDGDGPRAVLPALT